MDQPIPRAHQRTHDAVLQDPPPADLDWRLVRAMLGAIATATTEPHGRVRVERAGRVLVLHADRHKGRVSEADARMVRQFLEGTVVEPVGADGHHLVVVVNDKEARVYRVEPREGRAERLAPYDPQGAGRSMLYLQDAAGSTPTPEREGFSDAVSRALRGAGQITVLGRGKTAQDAVNRLTAHLREREPALAQRVGETALVETNPTPDQLLTKVRSLTRQNGKPALGTTPAADPEA